MDYEARANQVVAEAHKALEDPTARGAFLCALATKLVDANRLCWMESAASIAVAVAGAPQQAGPEHAGDTVAALADDPNDPEPGDCAP